jgi:hypothetical protein
MNFEFQDIEERVHASYQERFGEYIPWPYRRADDPIPAYCPRCGRKAFLRSWKPTDGRTRYWDMTCWGPPPLLWFNWILYRLGWPEAGHWAFPVGKSEVSYTAGDYDPRTGQRI